MHNLGALLERLVFFSCKLMVPKSAKYPPKLSPKLLISHSCSAHAYSYAVLIAQKFWSTVAVLIVTAFILTACKAAQAVDCGAEALMVPGTEATLPVILEPQDAAEGWNWKRLK